MRYCTGMRVPAEGLGAARPQRSANACHYAYRKAAVLEHRTLLDVQLEVSPDALRSQIRLGVRAEIGGVESGLVHALRQRLAGTNVQRRVQLARPQQAQHRTAAEVPAVVADEPGAALLGADSHHGNVALERQPKALDGGNRGQSCNDTGGPIEIAAM